MKSCIGAAVCSIQTFSELTQFRTCAVFKTSWAVYAYRNIEARSRKRCCRAEAISYKCYDGVLMFLPYFCGMQTAFSFFDVQVTVHHVKFLY